jgi:DNA (cytosine-5)-methyltransferase 1
MGYYRAGFDVLGVDIAPQKHYPFEFVQMGAIRYLSEILVNERFHFDAVHASPPCQAFTALRSMPNAREHPNLIEPTREMLRQTGVPWVLENVVGAPLENPVILCGTMFGLGVVLENAELWRHRLFETNWEVGLVHCCAHRARPRVVGVYGGHGRDRRRVVQAQGHSGGRSYRAGTQQFSAAARREAMGIDWMTDAELSQAIPPAYTEFIGRRLLEEVRCQHD